jgi:glyoxylase-like metal-dependent hydrolase (beta-lactamase superfamily II)
MLLRYILTVLILLSATIASGKQDFSKVTIKTSQLTDNIHMLTGAGGNMALCKGERGVFLIDDQFAPLTDKILAAVSTISDKPVKFLINTHWHRDHTGGNENIGKGDTIIVAHENVRKRLAAGQFMKAFNAQIPPAPDQALPVITFPTALTFHWDQETIEVTHFPGAHTDGDAVIFFKTANIIHTGDLFFNGIYPFIDVQSGGSISGMITSVEKLLQRADKNTKIIPGHGPLGNRADLENYRVMLTEIHARISKMRAEGMTQDQIIAAKPTSDFDEKWGKGFLAPDKWVGIVYSSMD